MVDPPRAGDHLGVPGSAAAHTGTARLLQGEQGHRVRGVVVADDGAAGAMKLSMHVDVI